MKIDDIEIIPENIITITIREWVLDVVPRLYCILNDDGMLSEVFNINDNAKITLMLGKHPNDENPIRTEFLLQDFKFNLVGDNQNSIVSFTGLLYSKELYFPIRTRCFKNKNSLNVLDSIASECGLKFEIPLGFKTNDNMNWLQINQPNFLFLKHIKNRAYKENDGILIYTDIYKNLKATSIKYECEKAQEKTAIYDQENYTKFDFDNIDDAKTIWYNYYDHINLNGTKNKINNYGIRYNYWDITNGNIEKNINNNESILAQRTFKEDNYLVDSTYNGIENNVHKFYSKAISQNKFYIDNFFSYVMTLNINSLSNVKLFDKINLIVPSMPTYGSIHAVNDIMSGKYLTAGIIYGAGKSKVFRKQIVLSRDGNNNSNFQL